MKRLRVEDKVKILTGEDGDQENTGFIMGITSDFKDQNGQQVSDPTYHIEMADGTQGDYKRETLQALEA